MSSRVTEVAAISQALLTPQQQRALTDRIRGLEPSAEEELVKLFRDRILFFALSRTRDADAAQDLTQDVMLAVVQALRNGQLRDGERLGAFVYGTARNLINNFLRERSRRPDTQDIDSAVAPPMQLPDSEGEERRELVARALAGLAPVDREIFALSLVEGLKPAEIASRLDMTSEVVRARKCRALKKVIDRVKKLSRT